MFQIYSYRSVIGQISILSSLVAGACLITGMFAVQFNFEAFSNPVRVLWNTLQTFFAATCWIALGSLLYKNKKWAGVLSMVTGISCRADGLGNITRLNTLAKRGLNAYLMPGIIWSFVVGVYILKAHNQTTLKVTE